MALRVGWGATKIFAFAAGGFHPALPAAARLPAARRLGDRARRQRQPAAADGDLLRADREHDPVRRRARRLRQDGHLRSGPSRPRRTRLRRADPVPAVRAAGRPRRVDRHRCATAKPLLHAALHATLTGPTPWHAIGYAEFDFLGKHRIDVRGRPSASPAHAAAARDRSPTRCSRRSSRRSPGRCWAALPPARGAIAWSRCATATPGRGVLVHPLGVAQRPPARPAAREVDRPLRRRGRRADDVRAPGLPGRRPARRSRPARGPLRRLRARGVHRADRRRAAGAAGVRVDAVGRQGGGRGVAARPTDARRRGDRSATRSRSSTSSRRPAPSASAPAGAPRTIPDRTLAGLVHGGAAAPAETRLERRGRVPRAPASASSVPASATSSPSADTLATAPERAGESSAEAHDRLANAAADGARRRRSSRRARPPSDGVHVLPLAPHRDGGRARRPPAADRRAPPRAPSSHVGVDVTGDGLPSPGRRTSTLDVLGPGDVTASTRAR